MRRLKVGLGALLLLVLVPAMAFAQATIAGVVKDASGAVLPGVTVEVASPALIEKTRTAVTDGTGTYRVVDLRPGTYAVTFTLTGETPIVDTQSVRRQTTVSNDIISNMPAARSYAGVMMLIPATTTQ